MKNLPPTLELLDVSKRFGEAQALVSASLVIRPGEVHALLGENGAGKTTLVSIAAGLRPPDGGLLRLRGHEVRFVSPRAARRAGIALVPQHDLLVEAFSVADNLALLDPSAPFFESSGRRGQRARRLAERFGLDLGPTAARAGELPVGTRQRIEIAGALAGEPEVLILDEPTAVMAPDETASLFASLRRRAALGRAVVLITHRIPEVFQAADRLTLLARGKTVRTCLISETTPEEIGDLLLGSAEGRDRVLPGGDRVAAADISDERDREEMERNPFPLSGGCPAAADLGKSVSRPSAVKGALRAPRSGHRPLTAAGRELSEPGHLLLSFHSVVPFGSSAPPVSFSLNEAELLVLLAIDGNGADTLARCVVGLHGFSGRIDILGRPLHPSGDTRAFRRLGGRFVPADRRAEGLVAPLSLEENLALASRPGRFVLDRAGMRARALESLARFGVRAASPGSPAGALSGGNQQKLVLAREMDDRSGRLCLLVAIHPTRGLDLAASADVRARIEETRRTGAAVLVVGSDPEEARGFGGTLRVVYRGAVSEPLPAETPLSVLSRRMAGLAA